MTTPYEVFSSTRQTSKVLSKNNINVIYNKPSPFKVFTISSKTKDIITSGGMKVISDYSFSDTPKFDILLIPGKGTRKLISDNSILSWINDKKDTKLIISVCTGSLLLGAAGLLKNKKATTHWSALNLLKKLSPSTKVLKERFVMDEIFSSSGSCLWYRLVIKSSRNFLR